MSRTVVIGGGYAGLACLSELSKKDRSAELTLIDSQDQHVKLTQLHKTLRRPLNNYRLPYAKLGETFNFNFYQQALDLSPGQLKNWLEEGKIELPETSLPFDQLVISSGAAPIPLPAGTTTLTYTDLLAGRGPTMIEKIVAQAAADPLSVSLVGGGATGIQVLFELNDILRDAKVPHQLRLIDFAERLVPGLPRSVHRTIRRKLERLGIDYLANTRYLGKQDGQIQLQEASATEPYSLPSAFTFLFPGVRPAPQRFAANRYGQVLLDGELREQLYTCGDCSSFNSPGLNSMTAQAALRKGKVVAKNIIQRDRGRSLHSYRYSEKGYIISLGRRDAVGWAGLKLHRIHGLPAHLLKESMEVQYDLFLSGIDTFVDL